MQTHTFPMLYKTNSNGSEQYWQITVYEHYSGKASYRSNYGQVGGKEQSTIVELTEGKNIGRANETTTYEQALSEARAKHAKQEDKGYSENRGGASMDLKPMLAHSYDKYGHKIKYPCYAQPKLDGIRCIAYLKNGEVFLKSRQGKPFNLPHIADALKPIFLNEAVAFDGELYSHDIPFQTITSLVKKHQKDTPLVQYHIYDLVYQNVDFNTRHNLLRTRRLSLPLIGVHTIQVETEADITQAHSDFVKLGYEGLMLRNADGLYQCGYRSHDLLKVKSFKDDEFEIVGAYENIGKAEGECSFIMRTKDGTQFNCKPEGTAEQRREYWQNRHEYIGKFMTVRFFEWTTSDKPVPRFPIATGIVRSEYE